MFRIFSEWDNTWLEYDEFQLTTGKISCTASSHHGSVKVVHWFTFTQILDLVTGSARLFPSNILISVFQLTFNEINFYFNYFFFISIFHVNYLSLNIDNAF